MRLMMNDQVVLLFGKTGIHKRIGDVNTALREGRSNGVNCKQSA